MTYKKILYNSVVTMYIDDQTYMQGGRSYRRILLRESYREGGKVKTRTIANVSKCSDEEIAAIKTALKMKGDLPALKAMSEGDAESSKSVGAITALYQVAQKIGITRALGNSTEGLLVLWLIIARFFGAGSRLAAVRYANIHAVCEVLGITPFNEDDLYMSLDWLSENQAKTEVRLFREQVKRDGEKSSNIYLYDLTSSYLEGDKNELAAFGYSRDKKKGKKQICYGLLTDSSGEPVSVEAFKGNTSDHKTLENQILKLRKRFGCEHITIVGDKGMVKKAQIKTMENMKYLNYITSITKPQIRSLVSKELFQYELFEETVAEVYDTEDKIRYILRRNPVRCTEIRNNRREKLGYVRASIAKANEYLAEHPRAKTDTQLNRMKALVKKLKAKKYVIIEKDGKDSRRITFRIDRNGLREVRKLDGCYVIKTDLPTEAAESREIHDRYKDLIFAEQAFRAEKSELNVRPIYLRKEERTRAHLFVVMLAYKLHMALRKAWRDIDITVDEGLKELSNITATNININDRIIACVPKPNRRCGELLELLNVRIPKFLPYVEFDVVTRTNLSDRRKVS